MRRRLGRDLRLRVLSKRTRVAKRRAANPTSAFMFFFPLRLLSDSIQFHQIREEHFIYRLCRLGSFLVSSSLTFVSDSCP